MVPARRSFSETLRYFARRQAAPGQRALNQRLCDELIAGKFDGVILASA